MGETKTFKDRRLLDLSTPCLVLDEEKMARNVNRLRQRLASLDVSLRPHLKTAKSIDVACRMMDTNEGPATVSTLREAEQFAAAGVRDILYAVGIAPQKIDRALALRRRGIELTLVADCREQARAIASAVDTTGISLPTLIEVDCDGHRSGIKPGEPEILEVGQALGASLSGVMTHAGASYDLHGADALIAMAEQEKAAACVSASLLRSAGLPCPIVSIGSTPTALFGRDFKGVTEIRAGVFVFFDLVMSGIGVCSPAEIALSVLATVIGHQREKGWIIIDAGWMALSRDRGTAKQTLDQGYGVVCDLAGNPYRDVIVSQCHQEHGIVSVRDGSDAPLPRLPIGTMVRILPNHACATGAQHDRYYLLGASGTVEAEWGRFSGW